MEEESKNPIQVAEKLFRVIELLAENGPMGIMELSASLGFHKSTVHRLVASLQYMGYIRQDEESLKYSLSLKFLEIGSRILEQTSMAALIHPSLKRLSEQTGETVHLVKREGTEAVYIDKVESFASSIRMVSRVGSRIPLYCSGVERVEQVRKDGYAVDDEENEEGVRCIAASLRDYHKDPVYALSISAPANRMTDQRILELKEYVLAFRQDLSRSLGLAGK